MATSVKDLDKALKAAGWHLIRSRKHLIYGCPCGQHLLTAPATPSDPRSIKNTSAQFARLSRACVR